LWDGGFGGFLHDVGCVCAELVPVVAIVADEVGNLAEGLVRGSMLDGHGFGVD
jgi:hypothetical protein